MTALEALREARAQLVSRGWCQKTLKTKDGRVCAFGALNCAVFCDPDPDPRMEDAEIPGYLALKAVIFADGGLTGWNDQPGRTVDEVLAAFDRAIAAEEVAP